MAGDGLGLYDVAEALALGAAGDNKLLGHQPTADHTAEVGHFGVITTSKSAKDRLKTGCQAGKLAHNVLIGIAENRYYSNKTDDTIRAWRGGREVLLHTTYGAGAGVKILEVADKGPELSRHTVDKIYLIDRKSVV